MITFNDIDFHFKSDNTLDFCDEPVLAFALKNICPNHITSIHLKNIEQCVVFENGTDAETVINKVAKMCSKENIIIV